MTLERGKLLHKRYRIVEILGQGGMGSVYRAVDENLGVDVAVKENLFTTDDYARQFRLEAVILANLRHPNLPRVTDHFTVAEQGQYLVMDYIEGEDLRQRMERQGAVSEEEVVLIGAAICDALTFLHTRTPPIIHRDVKPGNVKITPEGQIFLVDFGLAKLVKGSQATTTGARAMTPGYSPPEQYGTARTDPRTDIYSLGATLYAALTYTIPEDGLARAMDNVELTPLRKRNPKVSRRLATAIEKALAIYPEDRFQSADEFKQALLSFQSKTQRLAGELTVTPAPETSEDSDGSIKKPITARVIETPPLPPSRPRKKRRKGSCWIPFFISFFILAISAGALYYFWPSIPQSILSWLPFSLSPPKPLLSSTSITPTVPLPGETYTQTPTEAFTPTKTTSPTVIRTPTNTPFPSATWTPTVPSTPTSTPAGGGYGQIAFASHRSGVPQIFISTWDAREVWQITDLPEGACQPDWSPDGTQLVFISPCQERKDSYSTSSLYIANADGSEMVSLPSAEGGDYDPDWSPDGSRIVFTSLRDGYPQIYVIYLEDNSLLRLTETEKPVRTYQPVWSPQGTQIVYVARRYDLPPQLWVMTDTGQDQRQLVRSGSTYWDFSPVWSPEGESILFTQSQGPWLGWLMAYQLDEPDTEASRIKNGLYASNADFSPDGSWLVFESSDGKNEDIFIIMTDGSNRTRLTTDATADFDPSWRPGLQP